MGSKLFSTDTLQRAMDKTLIHVMLLTFTVLVYCSGKCREALPSVTDQRCEFPLPKELFQRWSCSAETAFLDFFVSKHDHMTESEAMEFGWSNDLFSRLTHEYLPCDFPFSLLCNPPAGGWCQPRPILEAPCQPSPHHHQLNVTSVRNYISLQ